jgi:hypothetical protein
MTQAGIGLILFLCGEAAAFRKLLAGLYHFFMAARL